jgi:DNA-binding IclR family transcriptional regulator
VQVVGARAPFHITAVGKIFLSQDGNAACAAYAKRAGLRAYTENTITSAAKLKKQVEQAERDGFALDEEEAERGVCCIGAGIRDSNGRIIAGLSLSAPADRIKFAWADRVKQCAQEISRTLGYRG